MLMKQNDHQTVIIFDSQREAYEVLLAMFKRLTAQDRVTLSEFYDLVDVTGFYNSHRLGWTNLDSAMVLDIKGVFVLELPDPIQF